MHWTEIVRRRHAAAQAALARRVNQMSVTVPIGDSDMTAPGYLHLGHFFSCVPDPQYPWDRDVLRAIRELCPDAMPVTIRSVWQWSNYGELGHLGEPMVITRHGLARAIESPVLPVHDFRCEMPSWPVLGLRLPGRSLEASRPNYIEVNWYDKEVRLHGMDLPGAYLPFDWEFYHALRRSDEQARADLAASRREVAEDGDVMAVGAGARMVAEHQETIAHRDKHRREEAAYVTKDILEYHREEPSDVEWKQVMLGGVGVKPDHVITEGAR